MSTDALIFMIVSEVLIASITIYFFVKVLRSKRKFNNESFDSLENNAE
jgi:hypothetical protein